MEERTRTPLEEIYKALCRVQTDRGVGTGFFVKRGTYSSSKTGFYLVTSNHVVEGADKLTVHRYLGDDKPLQLENLSIICQDFSQDLAVIHLHSDEIFSLLGAPSLPIAEESPKLGDQFVTCGFPLGANSPRAVQGLISSKKTKFRVGGITIEGYSLDASINRGNSGGPVCNIDGEVVGVVAAKSLPGIQKSLGKIDDGNVRKVFKEITMNLNLGIGYAVAPDSIPRILQWVDTQLKNRPYKPRAGIEEIPVRRTKIVEFQRKCKEQGATPIGPFSCRPRYNKEGNEIFEATTPFKTKKEERNYIRHPIAKHFVDVVYEERGFNNGGKFFLRGEYICPYSPAEEAYVPRAKLVVG